MEAPENTNPIKNPMENQIGGPSLEGTGNSSENKTGTKTIDLMKSYRAKVFATFLAAALIIIFYFCVKRYDGLRDGWNGLISILTPFFIGAVMAFIMDPLMTLIEKRLNRVFVPKSKKPAKTKHKVRLFSATIAILVLIGIITVFLVFVIPQIVSTLTYIYNHLEEQLIGVIDWANKLTSKRFDSVMQEARKPENISNFLTKVEGYIQDYLDWNKQSQMVKDLTSIGMSVGKAFVAFLVGIVAAIYMMTDKEKAKSQTKQIIFGLFPAKAANVIMEVLRKTLSIFYGFIVGKIIDSAIIGVICYICMLIFRMPYPVLVSVIVGVTNVIPVFGPYIGAVPTVTIIFFTNPMKGIYFLIFIIVLQQVDGNIIGPKILGDSTGISAFWVLFSIVVGGGLFGFVGMLLGVPIMALIYYICSRLVHHFAKKRGLPEATRTYENVNHVEGGRLVMNAEMAAGKAKDAGQAAGEDK
ncbi:MAG: AI-2E family transporter [Lachnospiraceae bacterium]|nr:AI-2E family transporter [Lachnospiraceae bacterium]